jgi:hypothetical protein
MTTPLHILNATIDQVHFETNPHRYVIEALRKNIENPNFHPDQPNGNCFILGNSNQTKQEIIQTSIRPHTPEGHKVSISKILFQGPRISAPFTLEICYAIPVTTSKHSVIARDHIYQEASVLEHLEPILRQQSTSLNTWELLNSLNTDFEDLLHTKKLTVTVE